MTQNIAQLIDAVIGREGHYSNQPADKGGATCWGITEQTARANGYKGDMAAMPREAAVAIYQTMFWTLPHFDQVAAVLPSIAAELFDMGVNQGVAFACTCLQRALNVLNRGASDYPDVAADSHLGPMSIAALRSYRAKRPDAEGEAVLLLVVRALRTGRYVSIAEANPSQEAFEYGWVARQVRAAA